MNRHEFYDNLNKYQTLSHSGNYKYYNKIDLPDGKTRYFYTKAEWDAYQEGLGRTAYENQKKVNNANKTSGGAKADAAREKANRDAYENMKGAKVTKPSTPNVLSDKDKQELAEKGKKQVMKVQSFDNNKKAAEVKELEEQKKYLDKYEENNKLTGIYDPKTESYAMGKMEKGHGFIEPDDENSKPRISASNFSFTLGDRNWTVPGVNSKFEKEDYLGYDDEDVKKLTELNKPIIDHCLDFYQIYVLDKGEMDDWDFNREVRNYMMDVFSTHLPDSFRYSDGNLRDAGIAITQVLEQAIKDKSEQMKKKYQEKKGVEEKLSKLTSNKK